VPGRLGNYWDELGGNKRHRWLRSGGREGIAQGQPRFLRVQVVQCVDGAFCRPPPDWVVRGATLTGPREFTAEYFIDWTPSIRPSRKLAHGMEKLEQYAENHPDDVVRRPPRADY